MMRCYSFSPTVCSCESSIINVSWEIIAYIFSSHQSPNRRTKRRKRGTFPPPHWCPQLLSKVRKYALKTAVDPSINVGHTLNCQKGLSPGRLLILLPSGSCFLLTWNVFLKAYFILRNEPIFLALLALMKGDVLYHHYTQLSGRKCRRQRPEKKRLKQRHECAKKSFHERDVRP